MTNQILGTTRLIVAFGLLLIVQRIAWSQDVQKPSNVDRTLSNSGNDATVADKRPAAIDLASIEQRVQAACTQVSPAVVRIDQGNGSCWTGVIISPQGHVLSLPSADPGETFPIHLPDGRQTTIVGLGWSEEWGIGIYRITDPGPWPSVQLGSTKTLQAGQHCAALGYVPRGDGGFDDRPSLRVGNITKVDAPFWFTPSCVPSDSDFGMGVFDMDGRLAGVVTRIDADQAIATAIDVVQSFMNDLKAAKNLDWVRYPPNPKSCFYRLGERDQLDRLGLQPWTAIEQLGLENTAQATEPNRAVMDPIKAATVRLVSKERLEWDKPDAYRWSGVIISRDGYIATCAHTNQLPGEKVTVALSNGRNANGVVLGTNKVTDVGLAKIIDAGEWPFVPLGDSSMMNVGDPIILAGYPGYNSDESVNNDRQPAVEHNVKVAKPLFVVWEPILFTELTYTPLAGGTSGGGAFDSQGRYIGVHQGSGGIPRVEVLKAQWDYLKKGTPFGVITEAPLADVKAAFGTVQRSRDWPVVEILAGERVCALGTVLSSDGMIVTKASELPKSPTCRLLDGRVLPATIVKRVKANDLAFLKIKESELPTIRDGSESRIESGRPLAALLPDKSLQVGVTSLPSRSIPLELPWKGEGLEKTKRGVEVIRHPHPSGAHIRLRPRDVILEIEGHAVQDLRDVVSVLEELSKNGLLPGDLISMQVKRGNKDFRLQMPLPSSDSTWDIDGYISPRRSGFSNVFDTDISLTREQCGGPVINAEGRVVGITIAVRGRNPLFKRIAVTHVIPLKAVLSVMHSSPEPKN